ncbi:hypothetical protein AB3S75_012911 [Citrus x aurantiifolia]
MAMEISKFGNITIRRSNRSQLPHFLQSRVRNLMYDVKMLLWTHNSSLDIWTIYGTKNPSPGQVEKAKSFLKEHERAILAALDKLDDISYGTDSPNERQRHFSHKECPRNVQGMVTHQSTILLIWTRKGRIELLVLLLSILLNQSAMAVAVLDVITYEKLDKR